MSKSLFTGEITFVAGAQTVKQLPKPNEFPEIAFIGKSNVGKSSLINALTGRKTLARVSHTPGRTQQINFFQVNKKFILVDLPGYGYAKVPSHMRNNWEQLILHYLTKRHNLRLINLLIDARRGIKDHDQEIIDFLTNYELPFQIIFTKSDSAKELEQLVASSQQMLCLTGVNVPILTTSSRKKDGLGELRGAIAFAIR